MHIFVYNRIVAYILNSDVVNSEFYFLPGFNDRIVDKVLINNKTFKKIVCAVSVSYLCANQAVSEMLCGKGLRFSINKKV